MYLSHFGLRQPPFSIAPDPRCLYMSERHREALAHLLYGVRGGGGFVLLTGEIGAGKTTVCRCFLEQVPDGCQVAYIFNPRLSDIELLQSVCDEFGITVDSPGPASAKACIDALNQHLLAAHAQGRQCVLIIDEAQNLAAEVLEQLRLLTNLETHERKLLQIVLIGQPELRRMLAGPGLEQLAQRIIARFHLGALSADETARYVAHRLAVAGLAGPLPFDARALRRIHVLCAGVPRRINLLCDRALLGAYAQGLRQVDRRTVERAAREVFDLGAPRSRPPGGGRAWAAAGGGLAGALAVVAGLWAWTATRGPSPQTVVAAVAGMASLAASKAASAASSTRPAAVLAAASAPAAASAVPALATPVLAPALAAAPAAVGAAAASAASAPVAIASAPAPAPAAAAAAALPAARVAAPPGPVSPALNYPPLLDAGTGLAAFPRDEQKAWRELARLWGLPQIGAAVADVCRSAQVLPQRCYRTASSTLAQLRQLDRPGLLVLRDAAGLPRYARLAGLGRDTVVLAAGPQAFSLPVQALGRLWRGEFNTFWRAPEGYSGRLQPGARGPAVDQLAQALARWAGQPVPAAGQVLAGPLAAQLADFQRQQGLRPDGVAGPGSFMLLDRALGGAAPRLLADLPER